MAQEKSVLVIGLDPELIDFSQPGYAPGMDATKVSAGLRSAEDELTRLGYRGRSAGLSTPLLMLLLSRPPEDCHEAHVDDHRGERRPCEF